MISNRVVVIIESDYEGEHGQRTVSRRHFDSSNFNLYDVLGAVEGALRGHGFHCPQDSLVVVKEDEDIVAREK